MNVVYIPKEDNNLDLWREVLQAFKETGGEERGGEGSERYTNFLKQQKLMLNPETEALLDLCNFCVSNYCYALEVLDTLIKLTTATATTTKM